MGSGLFDFRKYETTFKGKTVAMEIRPLKTKEMASVLPFFMEMQNHAESIKKEDLGDGKVKITVKDPGAIAALMNMQEKSEPIMASAVRNITGLEDDMKTICEEVYYFPFVMDVINRLFSITQLTEIDTKN